MVGVSGRKIAMGAGLFFVLRYRLRRQRGEQMSKSGARILVVDDEIEIMRALQRSLTAHGFEVFTAASGEGALEAITHYRPDLMRLDLGWPGMSGLEACKSVRAQSNLPIIVQ